ncbi:MAG: sensor histidine kinase [Alphaproteobacteria bacterium]
MPNEHQPIDAELHKLKTRFSLPAKLLLLTLVFIMLAEILIFLPSIGREQQSYISSRLASGHLAVLALEASPDGMVSDMLQAELLNHSDATVVGLKRPDGSNLVLMSPLFDPSNMPIARTIDLDKAGPISLIKEAIRTLTSSKTKDMIRALGTSPKDEQFRVEIVIQEAPLVEHLRFFAWRIFVLSFFISMLAASLIYVSLLMLFVRPVNRLTKSMRRFAEAPETETFPLPERLSSDELGAAQLQLNQMQNTVRTAFRERSRLAALGTAVTKINHDLRNLLGTSLLLSDSLETSSDPSVKRIAPRLIAEIERAADLCTASLKFARDTPLEPNRTTFNCQSFFMQLEARLTERADCSATFDFSLPDTAEFFADASHLERLFGNLFINANQAGATEINLVQADDNPLHLLVQDNGGGINPKSAASLFTPFSGTTKKDGSGLGLAITKDLLQAHGCDIGLETSSENGTVFRLSFNALTLKL